MMALADLLAALDEQAAGELAAATAAAEAEAARIREQAQADADAEVARTLAAVAEAARAETARTLASARRDAARLLAEAYADALASVRTGAAERLAALPGTPAGADALAACLSEALAVLPSATRVVVHPDDHAAAAALLAGSAVEVALGSPDAGGGARAEDASGRAVDNRLATRLGNAWPQLRVQVARGWREAQAE